MIEYIQENAGALLQVLGAFYVLATAIAALTPSDKDDSFLGKVGRFFDRVGLDIKSR